MDIEPAPGFWRNDCVCCGYSGRSGKYDYCTDIERRSAIETDK